MEIFPELTTNRLKLRKIQVDDVSSLVKYANNKKISDSVLNIPYPYQEPDAVFRIVTWCKDSKIKRVMFLA